MKKTRKRFKVGDMVYTTNPAWGLHPMTVIRLNGGGGATCKHPELGEGAFLPSELMPLTMERAAQVQKVLNAQAMLRHAGIEVFGENWTKL